MPRNGSGTYTLPSGNPVVSGTVIESTWANSTLADLADAITNSLARNGEGGMTAPLRLTDGVVATPSLAFANETGSGLYRAAAGDVGLAVLGSRILRLQAAGASITGTLGVSGDTSLANLAYTGTLTGGTGVVNIGTGQIYKAADGKVGIGTVSPATLLNLYGGSPHLRLTDSGTGAFGQFVSYDAGGGVRPTAIRVSNDGTGGTTDVMTWTSSNVGIGTSNPATPLHISSSAPQLRVQNPATGSFAQFLSYDAGGGLRPAAIRVSNDGTGGTTDVMTFTSSGNVGIGTSSPTSFGAGYTALTVSGSNAGIFQSKNTSGDARFYADPSGDALLGSWANTSLKLYTNSGERARIDSSGNLLVGTTSNGLSARVVFANVVGNTNFVLQTDGVAWGEINNHLNAGTQYFVGWRYAGNQIGAITGNNTSTSYATTSDYRLKENVQPMQGALETVAQLKPCTYTWKADGSAGQGFIAHELQEVCPDAVTGEKDAVDAEGNPQYQGVDTSFLVGILTAAIQELKAEVDALKPVSAA